MFLQSKNTYMIPKGITQQLQKKAKELGVPLVNENPKPQNVSPEVAAARAAVKENQQLRTVVEELKAKVATLQPAADSIDWQGRAKKAEGLLELVEDREWMAIRESRKFELFASMLRGAAAAGQLFGNSVKALELKKALEHYAAVAEVAEAEAIKRGY